jgi:hypothetical protein
MNLNSVEVFLGVAKGKSKQKKKRSGQSVHETGVR